MYIALEQTELTFDAKCGPIKELMKEISSFTVMQGMGTTLEGAGILYINPNNNRWYFIVAAPDGSDKACVVASGDDWDELKVDTKTKKHT